MKDDTELNIYYSSTGKAEHKTCWAIVANADPHKIAVDLSLSMRDMHPDNAVWINSQKVIITKAEEAAYAQLCKDILEHKIVPPVIQPSPVVEPAAPVQSDGNGGFVFNLPAYDSDDE